ncbi:MAG: SPOR domain-containing protein [Cytophagales bacterium]|nr:SPOR domain-containing protein [Cytophagales bacterium]
MKKLFFLSVLLVLLEACAPQKQLRRTSYSEDLSSYLPNLQAEAAKVEMKHKPSLDSVREERAPIGTINESLEKQYEIFAMRNIGKASTYYSIQIYSGEDRGRANAARSKLILNFPHLRPVLQWQSPIYRVRVGRFYDRLDAYKMLSEIRKVFPLAKSFPEKVVLSDELLENE